jgi:D-aminopeptidase
VFEKHPYFDVVPDAAEYDLQKDVLNAVLLAFERKAGEWCDISLSWQTFMQQVRSSTVEGIARKHSRTISSLPSMIRASRTVWCFRI